MKIAVVLLSALLLPACASRMPVDPAAQVPPPSKPESVKNKTEKQPVNQPERPPGRQP